jgi:glycosyltransferase involved in cell wall biosynthesis
MHVSILSIIIPTLDEELHLGRVVESAISLGPVFVVDSGSSDRTREIAEESGAQFVLRPWLGYANQKNWALDNLPISTDWVLFLDADEWLSPELANELRQTVSKPSTNGYYLARRNIFLGRELKHAWWYPDFQLRLFRRNAGRYEDRLVHEHFQLDGEPGFLEHAIMHENLKGIDEFMRRHERYAALEAREMRDLRRTTGRDQRRGSFRGSWPERRRALKVRIWYRLPARAAFRFAWMYFVRRGFLDGRRGLVYCQLIASYDALIDAKLLELDLEERRTDGRSPSEQDATDG